MMRNFFFFISILAFRFFLDTNYINVVKPLFDYKGFALNYDLFSMHNMSSYLMICALMPLLSTILKNKSTFVSVFVFSVFILRYIPNTSLIGLTNTEYIFVCLQFMYMFFILLSVNCITSSKIGISKRQLYVNYNMLKIIVIVCSIIVIAISGVYSGFRLNFSFLNVYDLRLQMRDVNMPAILTYIWPPIGNILPIAFVLLLVDRNIKMCCLIAFIVMLNFSIDGLKSTIFKLFIALLFYFFYNIKLLKTLPLLLMVLAIFATIEYLYLQTFVISQFFSYRALYIPCLLDNSYFDYIYNNEPLFYNMRDQIAFLIGDLYFNAPEMRTNNGLFSDAYMNLGAVGIVIYPIIYAVLLKIGDKIFCNIEDYMSTFIAFIFFYIIASTTLTTALLTHGIMLTIVLVYFITKKTNIKNLN